ncbi:hypothetical protein VIBNIAM115_270031 [Vibrio nigripulchritudo AM115]|nr:hypothetical protein VIBNIAM115_270031 [Vibrio nigripulchritudo AM115]
MTQINSLDIYELFYHLDSFQIGKVCSNICVSKKSSKTKKAVFKTALTISNH